MDNRAGEMEVFVTAVDMKSFSAAGRRLGLSPSAVSKLVSRLEDRLSTRLLVRTTRRLEPTPEGEVYLERARRILDDIADTEQVVASGGAAMPRGRLRVTASIAFGVHYVVPLVRDYLATYPEVQLELSLSDDVVDIVGERTDVAIRSGNLRDTSLKARKLLESRRVVIASPAYLKAHGTPATPEDLAHHNCLTFSFRPTQEEWPFRSPGAHDIYTIPVSGNFEANNGPTVRTLCVHGVGVARVGRFHVQAEIDAGRLVPVLEEFNPDDVELIHAVYAGHEHLAKRVRTFIDFLAARIA